ncbi:hypothetical protein F5B22DRAFT_99662 [Xylaria bambusicola]|uniref:uncharacterized protein n=1 Tax=Xylaria bambusicola TaxID=326684 RepID=UPI0020076D3D|nr:uncharacterized protein F5B22DRAFT_99662 [Xylaria bambusicola]KAI0517783.1 hypothetical protein F5B22DRAFT_99662 [Xylaria bambusicola]
MMWVWSERARSKTSVMALCPGASGAGSAGVAQTGKQAAVLGALTISTEPVSTPSDSAEAQSAVSTRLAPCRTRSIASHVPHRPHCGWATIALPRLPVLALSALSLAVSARCWLSSCVQISLPPSQIIPADPTSCHLFRFPNDATPSMGKSRISVIPMAFPIFAMPAFLSASVPSLLSASPWSALSTLPCQLAD